ncbi:hypothetical protein GCM10009751_05630 [Myceligenerans crystallogenes]|uniref:Bacterial type II secretion system protein E domain-containing protein n=2 Tax=Myceligenerans crystallogenes TaxID=316335 RepID=A0ABN2N5B5_9MICO
MPQHPETTRRPEPQPGGQFEQQSGQQFDQQFDQRSGPHEQYPGTRFEVREQPPAQDPSSYPTGEYGEYTPPPQSVELTPATEYAPPMPPHVLASLLGASQPPDPAQGSWPYAGTAPEAYQQPEVYRQPDAYQQPDAFERTGYHQPGSYQDPGSYQQSYGDPGAYPAPGGHETGAGSIPASLIGTAASYTATPAPDPRPAAGAPSSSANIPVDWNTVAMFRAQASERLVERLGEDRGRDTAAEKEMGREIIRTIVDDAAADLLHDGERAWSYEEQQALETAVYNALFGLGRLQPLIDDDSVENIIISGAENVWVETTDGELIRKDPVAGSDKELLEELAFVAQRSESNARNFTSAHPRLHMRLDGGSRLAAAAWVTARPSVVIRRHRLRRVSLDDLVGREMLSANLASFLAAAIKARKSVVVAGPQGAGKTTMVRALCAQIPRHEAIGTFETEFELHLHELPDVHEIVHAWEARPGSGEVGPDGRQAGEFGLDEALYDSFRFNLSRQIVGEVRGAEVWAMIKAMESGAGSISTTHAADGEAAVRKLVTCAMEAGSHVTRDLATTKLAETIDLVVQVSVRTTQDPDDPRVWRKTRRVTEVVHVSPGEVAKGYATTHVYRADPHGGPAVPGTMPDELRDLERWGFDLTGYLAAEGREAGGLP